MSSATLSPDIVNEEALPKEKRWKTKDLYNWEGFWFLHSHLKGAIAAKSSFTARDDDIILASPTKSGCTWLKAIISCIMDDKSRTLDINGDDHEDDMLTKNHPNELMPSLELHILDPINLQPSNFLSDMSSPRLLRTHIPYQLLSESIKKSRCKIVYIARDPKDVFVSLWYFLNSERNNHQLEAYPIQDAFDEFCRGINSFGPFHDHVLEYWKQSRVTPDKILFLKYEDMKKNSVREVTKLASFLGKPFDSDEEVEKVLLRCSLERLKNMEVNKNGIDPWSKHQKNAYFRKGVVGDWQNHLSLEMKEHFDEITRDKFQDSVLLDFLSQ